MVLLTVLALTTPSEIPGFQPVLLPMHYGITAGAGATAWRVDEVVFNGSDRPVKFYPRYADWGDHFFGPPIVGELAPLSRLNADNLAYPVPCRGTCPARPPGVLMWIAPEDLPAITGYDRVYELSADRENHGAIVPAVPQSSFRKGTLSLAAIPLSTNFRTMIRIYNMAPQAEATIRVYDSSGPLVATSQVALPAVRYTEHGIATLPGYTQISLESIVPGAEFFRVNVIIETDSASFWSFASVTSNSTQRVTIVTP